MKTKWRIFISGDQSVVLGVKAKQEGRLWIPDIVALSNEYDHKRLDRVTHPQRNQVEIADAKTMLTVDYVKCTLPLTLEDQSAIVGDTTLTEDLRLRALPNYGKRGTWYKIAPR